MLTAAGLAEEWTATRGGAILQPLTPYRSAPAGLPPAGASSSPARDDTPHPINPGRGFAADDDGVLRPTTARQESAVLNGRSQVGIPQTLLSEYERGTVRLHAAMVTSLAKVLHASTDVLLGVKPLKEDGTFQDRRLFRRLQRIEGLPKRARQTLLRTIDLFLEGAEKR
jgi:hypothetical protein